MVQANQKVKGTIMDKIKLDVNILRGIVTKNELAVSLYIYMKSRRIDTISLNLLMELFGYQLRTETAVKFRNSLSILIQKNIIAVSEDIENVKRNSNFSITMTEIEDEYLEVNGDIFNLVFNTLVDKGLVWLYIFLLSFKHKYEIYGAITINMIMLGFDIKDERTVGKYLSNLIDCGLINKSKSKVGTYNLFYYLLEEFYEVEIAEVDDKKAFGEIRRDLSAYGLFLFGMQGSFLPKFPMSNRILSLLIQGSIDSDKLKRSMRYHKNHVSYLMKNHTPVGIILNILARISYENYYSIDYKLKIYNIEYKLRDEQEHLYYYVDLDGNVQGLKNKIERDKILTEISKIKEKEKLIKIDKWKKAKDKQKIIEDNENYELFG